MRALAAYLAMHQHLPFDRMAQLFRDVLGQEVSVGALAQMVAKAADATGPFLDDVRVLLRDADAVHFDETGGRAAGRLHWAHSASTALLTLLDCHARRGTPAMDDVGVIGEMTGVAIHDGWRPYRRYDVWQTIEPLLAPPDVSHPLGCHNPRIPDKICFRGIMIRLVTGSSWTDIEAILEFVVSDTTLRARRDEWIEAGVFTRLETEARAAYDRILELDLDNVALDGSIHKAPCGGEGTGKVQLTGPNWLFALV